ncbi:hypothetical protein HZA55_09095, partial [Candidatus Poribacteria bacterium]|nr:hypothetical protein [Candidatus Poribacteria bacterium]
MTNYPDPRCISARIIGTDRYGYNSACRLPKGQVNFKDNIVVELYYLGSKPFKSKEIELNFYNNKTRYSKSFKFPFEHVWKKIDSMGGADAAIDKIMTSVDINPYIENGKFIGYSLNNIESTGDILTSAGLKNRDIIKEVDGIKLESPEKLFELYQSLYPKMQTLSSINITV